jgi:hypothetical protein
MQEGRKCENCKWAGEFAPISLYPHKDANPYAPQTTGVICKYCPQSCTITRYLDDWCYKFEEKDK